MDRFAPSEVWAGPLRRAIDTAEPLAEALGCELRIDPRLRERMNCDGDHDQPSRSSWRSGAERPITVRSVRTHLVVLRPRVEVVEQRDAERQRTLGKVAYRDGYTPAINDEHVGGRRRDLGLWLDSSEQTPGETVDEIMRRAVEARIR